MPICIVEGNKAAKAMRVMRPGPGLHGLMPICIIVVAHKAKASEVIGPGQVYGHGLRIWSFMKK